MDYKSIIEFLRIDVISVLIQDNKSSKEDSLDVPLSSDPTETHLKTKQMRISLPTLARESDRHGISDRCAAVIFCCNVRRFGVVHEGETSNVID